MKNCKKYMSNYWLSLIIKIFLCLGGFVLSTFGLALYQQPAVGSSQIDWVLYNTVSLKIPFKPDGSIGGEAFWSSYKITLMILNFIFIFSAMLFSIKPSIDDYKKSKSKTVWILFVWYVIADAIIAVSLPLLIEQFIGIVSKWVERDENGNVTSSIGVRNGLFIIGFICFCLGIGMWVKSGLILGPFNNVCSQFIRLTKLSYTKGRLIIDITILTVGFIFYGFIQGQGTKLDFLMTNFGLGTICFTFLVGPFVNQVINLLNKFIIFDKLTISSIRERKQQKEIAKMEKEQVKVDQNEQIKSENNNIEENA